MMRTDDRGRIAKHKALNSLLQGGGAVVMKQSCVTLWNDVRNQDVTAYKVLDMHDEGQSEVLIKDIELYSQIAVNSIVQAGEHFNLGIPLAAESMVGNNLAETH